MKKWIGAVLVVVIVIGGYVYFFKRSELIDNAVEDYLSEAVNIENVIYEENDIKITHTVKSYSETQVLGELTFTAEGNSETIPVTSDIERGKFEDKGQTFDYAHVVSRLDLSASSLPEPFNNEDFLGIEHFIDSKGLVRGKYDISAFTFQDETGPIEIDFKGANMVMDLPIPYKRDGTSHLIINGLNVKQYGDEMAMSTVDMSLKKDGETCEYSSQPMTIEVVGSSLFDLGQVSADGFCNWDEEFQSMVYDMKTEMAGLSLKSVNPEVQVDIVSSTGQVRKLNVGNGNAEFGVTSNVVPSPEFFKELGVNIEPTGIDVALEVKQVPYAASLELLRLNPNSSQDEIAAILVKLVNSNAVLNAAIGLLSTDGNIKLDSEFNSSDLAKNTSQEGLKTARTEDKLLPLVEGKVHIAADNAVLKKSGMMGMVNMLFGSFIVTDTVQDKSIVDINISDGAVLVNNQVYYQQ